MSRTESDMPLHAGSSHATASKAPYGLSFSLEELAEAKEWAERSQLALCIVLDHVIGDVEFEEVIVIGSADSRQRILTLWNTGGAIHAQAPHGRPRAHPTMHLALNSARPKPARRQAWRFFQS